MKATVITQTLSSLKLGPEVLQLKIHQALLNKA